MIGVVNPGEMGAALGRALAGTGARVLWASAGRSEATARRAREAGLEDVGTLDELKARCELIVSVCPPHAALAVARALAPFAGIYVDANAVAPATVREIERLQPRLVDGSIVGPPPEAAGTTRLYLSGPGAEAVAGRFAGTVVDAQVISSRIGDASALKTVYAAWTKGAAALLLAIRDVARAEGVEEALLAEWRRSQPELPERLALAERSAAAKGWRWVGEMEEIASAFAAAGSPDGFHRAAAEVFR